MTVRPVQDGILFTDRRDAGRKLGALLTRCGFASPLVLALPRGGVLVGAEVARCLGAPLDVVVARKLGAPGQPELAIGALAPDGVRTLDKRAMAYLAASDAATQAAWHAYLERATAAEAAELDRRQRAYRGDRPFPPFLEHTVILVDDGLATGMTARAALQWLTAQRPRRLVLAVPVAAANTVNDLRELVDDLVCLNTPAEFLAVGFHYEDFSQTSDDEVLQALADAARPEHSNGGSRGTKMMSTPGGER